jgi:hypothetical protein
VLLYQIRLIPFNAASIGFERRPSAEWNFFFDVWNFPHQREIPYIHASVFYCLSMCLLKEYFRQ